LQETLNARKAELTPVVLQLMEQMLQDLQASQREQLAGRLAQILGLAKKVTG